MVKTFETRAAFAALPDSSLKQKLILANAALPHKVLFPFLRSSGIHHAPSPLFLNYLF